MKKIITVIYMVSLGLCVFYLLYTGLYSGLDVEKKNPDEGYRILNDYQYSREQDAYAPSGVRETYTFRLDKTEGFCRELVFYTIHQNVDVYVGDSRVYRMRTDRQNLVGNTPGCVWNNIRFDEGDANKTIRVEIYPVYQSSDDVTPVFYYGDMNDIFRHLFFSGLPVVLLCLIGIGAGVVYIAYTLYNYHNPEIDKSLLMLGCFALAVSLWKLTDAQITKLLLPNPQIVSMLPFLLLQLMSVPFLMFIKEILISKDSKIWYIPIFYNYAMLLLTLFMQIFNIRDLRQNLFLIHFGLLLSVGVTIGMVIYEIQMVGWSARLNQSVFFLFFCFVGMGIDMGVYYISKGTKSTPLGMLGLVVYIFASGAFSLRHARELMNIGTEARNFERKAFHDQLTGLYNRTAYAEYTEDENFSPEQCIVAVFDLNNLKKCNDTLGHEKGDRYIKECASMISTAFSDIGKCYRMGGDEFCVLIEQASMSVCQQRMQKLQNLVAERNRRDPEIHMGIASGYERYDNRIDYTINDTSKRADKKMYIEKAAMKQAEAEQKEGTT